MSVLKDFLLELLFITIPLFIYQSFFADRLKNDKKANVVMSAIWGISLVLCMSFSSSFGQGYFIDIRIIPLLFGTLYCGFNTGIFLSSVIILYRYYLFGVTIGWYNTILAVVFFVPLLFFFQKLFVQSEKAKRVKIAVLLSLYYELIGNSWFLILRGFSLESLRVQVIHLIFILIVTWFFTNLSENLRENHRLRLELQNSDRSRIISDLTSVFAHEIRNPMQVIRGFLQLLEQPNLHDHKKKEYIQTSIAELDRANAIVNEFLSFGKPLTDKSERIDMRGQLLGVINMLQNYSVSRNVEIHADLSDNCWINADPQKVNQFVINILKNAIESMPNGGMVWVSCNPTREGYIELNIKDQGIGMTKEQIDRLGSPFYSLKTNGTGLGMMVSLQIIRSLAGTVHVTSDKDIGTKFCILLPSEG